MNIGNIYNKYKKKVQSAINTGAEDPILADAPAVQLDAPAGYNDYKPSTSGEIMDIDRDIEADPVQVRRIFDKVVEVFNGALPSFLRSSVDTERQKQYLYDALDESVKQYLASLDEMAQKRSLDQWMTERDAQRKEMEKLRERARELEKKKTEFTEQRLSADRQRRALNDRLQDLEKRLEDALAEKERLETENKGLVNKAKVANVFESDNEAMRKQLDDLKRNPIPRETMLELETLNKKVEELENENNKLVESCEMAKKKDEMNEAMINDMQKMASETKKSLKEAENTIGELNNEIKTRDARIEDLKQKISELESQLEDDRDSIDGIKEIASQLDRFESIKSDLEEKIRTLNSRIIELENENKTLKDTIKTNLYSEAERQKELIDEIQRLYTDKENASDDASDEDDDSDGDVLLDMTNN